MRRGSATRGSLSLSDPLVALSLRGISVQQSLLRHTHSLQSRGNYPMVIRLLQCHTCKEKPWKKHSKNSKYKRQRTCSDAMLTLPLLLEMRSVPLCVCVGGGGDTKFVMKTNMIWQGKNIYETIKIVRHSFINNCIFAHSNMLAFMPRWWFLPTLTPKWQRS